MVRQLVEELEQGLPASNLLRSAAARSRLAELGRQSSEIAHELRQPLFTIAMATENLRLLLAGDLLNRARMQQAVSRIAEQVERAEAIIESALGHADPNPDPTAAPASGDGEVCDAAQAAANAVRFLSELFTDADIVVSRTNRTHSAVVGATRIEMEQVFVNLLRNAVDSICERRATGWRGKGHISVRVTCDKGDICCVVGDNGAGVARDVAEAAFDPFYTTKQDSGTGLGLHICRQIVERASGSIKLASGDEGAEVEIRMPFAGGQLPSDVVAA